MRARRCLGVLSSAFAYACACMLAHAAPNKLPTVTLTAPTNGATFTAPANVALAATASDADGTIARVEFYQGTTLLGTRTAAPYTLTWSNVAGGSYSLTARAVDDRGGAKTSTAVAITVTGPKIVIVAPANGANVYAGSVAVTGTFYGDPSTTAVLVDNGNTTRVATLDANTYSATVPLHVGANALRVIASRRDRTSDQASVSVTGHGNPLLVFTAPAAATFDAPASVTFAVDAVSPAGSIAKVDFYRNGALFGTSTAPPYQQTWNAIPAGTHSISAIATDALGATGGMALALTVNGPNAPPSVTLTSPAGGAVFTAPASISMTASAADADGSVALVEFLQNGNVVGTTNVAPYAVTWTNVSAGTYTLTARATDNRSGVTLSAPVSVTVSPPNSPPSVTLVSPASGSAYVAPAAMVLAATAADSDGSVAKVEFYAGTTLLGTLTAAPWTFAWNGVAPGTYSLTARATDNFGATATSAPVVVTVTVNQPPSIALVAPAAGGSFDAPATINLAATASDPDGTVTRVDFYAGAALVGTSSGAPYAATWIGVGAGSYALTAKATDNFGAVSISAPVAVTVNAPALTITSPADGATIAGDAITVSGTVAAPLNTGITVNGVIAAIDASGHFYAHRVPLVPGPNTIDVVLTTLAGFTATQSIAVTSAGAAPFRVSASPTQGLAPLDVTFEVAPGPDFAIQKIELDADGNGTYDATLNSEPWTLSAIYSGSGTIVASVRVTDAQGVVRAEAIPIVLETAAALDAKIRAVWSGMTTALADGDKPGALRHLDSSAQAKYGPVFDALLPYMPQIVGSFSPLQSLSLSASLGEYAVNRMVNGENRIFLVYFSQNGDGVWRLGAM